MDPVRALGFGISALVVTAGLRAWWARSCETEWLLGLSRAFLVPNAESRMETLRSIGAEVPAGCGSAVRALAAEAVAHAEQLVVEANQRRFAVMEIGLSRDALASTVRAFFLNVTTIGREVLDCERFSLFLFDERAQELWTLTDEEGMIIRVPVGVGIAGHVAATREELVCLDAYELGFFDHAWDQKSGFLTKSVRCRPIWRLGNGRELLGVVQAINFRHDVASCSRPEFKALDALSTRLSTVLTAMSLETSLTKLEDDAASNREGGIEALSSLRAYSPVQDCSPRSLFVANAETIGPCLDNIGGEWSFDTLACSRGALLAACHGIFLSFGALDALGVDESKFVGWVRAVGAAYRPNPYHNFRHGVHVLHSTAALLRSDAAKHVASNHLESFPLLMAALAHDVDHPGRTNSFEIAKQSELALCYSDDSVLERHHAATTFGLMRTPETNALHSLSPADYAYARQTIIRVILATDMARHKEMCFELSLAEDGTFANVGQVPPRRASEGALCGKALSGKASFRRPVLHVFMDNIIHMADVSAQTMPPHLARKWGDCVTQEFAEQAAEEATKGLPTEPHMMGLDDTRKLMLSQLGFCRYVLKPYVQSLERVMPDVLREAHANLNANMAYYATFEVAPGA